ncbi:hypothetical protein CAMRE0001_0072 [Campylobacter rectus RM3267]|uniref:Uncharacterized protein n=1 Tax=Campylobacter rectus RM3267 TaxID=553218 RepID=B9CXR2_CAMRE|nr:hypothetical protein CAMRE0001_0072 [Campylobacter rectus RM3267]
MSRLLAAPQPLKGTNELLNSDEVLYDVKRRYRFATDADARSLSRQSRQ